jgi:uncharacterized damage-inducible protein DinB
VQPVEHYDVLRRAREDLLNVVGQLTTEQYAQSFPFGLKTVRATLIHLANAEWLNARIGRGEDVTATPRPFTEDAYPDLPSLRSGWKDLEPGTRAWLTSESDWTRRMETTARRSDGSVVRIVFTPEKLAFQLCYHEVHHRAQVMAMLRQMGGAAQNLDFNRYTFEWTELPTA